MHKTSGLGARLRDFAAKFGGPSGLARELGLKPQVLNDYLVERTRPGNKMQERLRKLGCDVEWLMTGRTREETKPRKTGSIEYRIEATVPAGVSEPTDRSEWHESEPIDYNPEHYAWIVVSDQMGESMKPALKPGDMLLVTERERLKTGDLVVAKWGRHAAVKIYTEGDDRVLLTSINPTVAPIALKKSEPTLFKIVLIKKK